MSDRAVEEALYESISMRSFVGIDLGCEHGQQLRRQDVHAGYDYALSKRTNVGVFYSRLDNDARGVYQPFLAGTSMTGTAPVTGETASTFALSLKTQLLIVQGLALTCDGRHQVSPISMASNSMSTI